MNLRNCIATLKRFKRSASRAWSKLTVLTRSIILLIIKSLVASFVLAALTPVATAYYAITFGFRVPIEGVPYVSAAMATLAFLGFLLTGLYVLSFLIILRHAKIIVRLTEIMVKMVPWLPWALTVQLDSVLTKKTNWALIIAATALSIVLQLLFYIDFNAGIGHIILMIGMVISINLLLMISLAVLSNLTSFFQFQISLSAAVIVVSAACLFSTNVYGSFLRVIRYGGGVEYEIVVANGSTPTTIKGYLLIQNDQMVVMMNQDRTRIVEIPARLIESKGTSISPDWKLPDNRISSQTRYLSFQ